MLHWQCQAGKAELLEAAGVQEQGEQKCRENSVEQKAKSATAEQG